MTVIVISSMASRGSRRLGFVVVALLAAVVAGCAPPSASSVFKEVVSDNIPESVNVLNYHVHEGPGFFKTPTCWIRFAASRNDLEAVIEAEQFVERSSRSSLEFDHLYPPPWWKPGDLGEDFLVYEREECPLDSDNSTWKKFMYINSDMNESYCFKLMFW